VKVATFNINNINKRLEKTQSRLRSCELLQPILPGGVLLGVLRGIVKYMLHKDLGRTVVWWTNCFLSPMK
jgi:hypothetical protein